LFNNQVYRQGAVIKLKDFLAHLVKKTFENQPMARFSNLTIAVTDQNHTLAVARGGSAADDRNFTITRQFPRPFSFISAQLSCASPPRSAGRATLQFMLLVLVAVILLGLFAIYQSSRAVVALSERRSAFVSSVTHELKTPLTTIRMYIEMLEQGIARTPGQQYEYYSILNSETNRLTRLINNVLAFSKLETKQQRLDIQEHDFEAVCREVEKVMALKLQQTDFRLQFNIESEKLFRFDREAMIQILINLIDNSIKFGRSAASREITIRAHASSGRHVISVADTGPGIPHQDLKKIFNNYFRADNDLTRATGGTGIGLALVKSYITSMNGSVCAENNTERGCTITMTLPD
ncbi:MAG: HAMP domain-containing histidine kinase, partial [Deltaproteobacteria bacterium]|nr:HAMP domain-containing histidine kinase [Deltaproteobacteria bacterium]